MPVFTRRIKLGGVAVVECGVCGLEKVPEDKPGARPCGRVRVMADGRHEPCTAHVIHENEKEADRG